MQCKRRHRVPSGKFRLRRAAVTAGAQGPPGVREEPRSFVIVAATAEHGYLPGSGVWWDIAPAGVSGDGLTQQLWADYERERGGPATVLLLGGAGRLFRPD